MKQKVDLSITTKDYFTHGIFFTLYGLVKYIPSPIGDILRYIVIKPFIKKVGKARIFEGATFWYPYRIKIGSDVTINEWVYLSGFGGLEIKNGVRIGHRTTILTSDHNISDRNMPIFKQGLKSGKVVIGEGSYIGCNVTILQGVNIGSGSVVGAGSVVTKNIPPFSIIAGVPAKVIRKRK